MLALAVALASLLILCLLLLRFPLFASEGKGRSAKAEGQTFRSCRTKYYSEEKPELPFILFLLLLAFFASFLVHALAGLRMLTCLYGCVFFSTCPTLLMTRLYILMEERKGGRGMEK